MCELSGVIAALSASADISSKTNAWMSFPSRLLQVVSSVGAADVRLMGGGGDGVAPREPGTPLAGGALKGADWVVSEVRAKATSDTTPVKFKWGKKTENKNDKKNQHIHYEDRRRLLF